MHINCKPTLCFEMLYFWMILFIHVLGPHRVSGCCQCRARMMWYDPDEESCKTCFCTFGLALHCGTWTCQEFGKCDKNFIAPKMIQSAEGQPGMMMVMMKVELFYRAPPGGH